MPSSDPCNIPLILKIVCEHKPRTILDVGIGCGKYGLLFREYLDGHRQGRAFHDPETWGVHIVGVEVFRPYITPVHNYIYNKIIIGDICHLLSCGIDKFDLIFLGDIIEHFNKEEGRAVLLSLGGRLTPNGMILVSTPNFESNWSKPMPFGNEHERHHCRWTIEDFAAVPTFAVSSHDCGRLLTVEMRRAA